MQNLHSHRCQHPLGIECPAIDTPAIKLPFSYQYKPMYEHITLHGGITHQHDILPFIPDNQRTAFTKLPELIFMLTDMSSNAAAAKAFASALMSEEPEKINTQLNLFLTLLPQPVSTLEVIAKLDPIWKEKIRIVHNMTQAKLGLFQEMKKKHTVQQSEEQDIAPRSINPDGL